MKKTLIYGYFTKNYGDDLLIYSYIKNFSKSDNIYTLYNVLPQFKSEIFRELNVEVYEKTTMKRILNKFDPYKIYVESKLANEFDELVIIGGSMFIEEREDLHLYRMMSKFVELGKEVKVLGANFGPVKTTDFVKKYDALFKNCTEVIFRDKKSFETFQGVNSISLGTDLAMLLDIEHNKIKSFEDIVAIIPVSLKGRRELQEFDSKYKKYLDHQIEMYQSSGKTVRVFGFCAFEGDDEIITYLSSKHSGVEPILYDGDLLKFTKLLGECSVIIGSRFHAIIVGILINANVLSISYSDKNSNFLLSISSEISNVEIRELDSTINVVPRLSNHDMDILSLYQDVYASEKSRSN
ncbi:polysaccharide pyruvyl transferase family protein [Erysipelothrix sp. HDW6B]|uniref:polysaccharide pyruvyl transferase family protein n=1 Tax=Erysipelothrix sp. HDW6B TaxID=2714929 RepID=UPI00140AE973|nr:polysaccharide pyruvyl transferase family protein [Erysipelothrix sp. HDW6B]QIK86858.1 polysaccharide pyruvyl transferase family protein [Erysipelothrix sp. HDW6B]